MVLSTQYTAVKRIDTVKKGNNIAIDS